MNKLLRKLFAIAISCSLIVWLGATALAKEGLNDAEESSLAYQMLNELSNRIVSGTWHGQFDPEGTISRQDTVILLVNLLNIDSTPNTTLETINDFTFSMSTETFLDVSYFSYAYVSVEAAARTGLIRGYGSNMFGGHDPITREDLIVLFVRAWEYVYGAQSDSTETTIVAAYDDWADTSQHARSSILKAQELELIEHFSTFQRLEPKKAATREDVAIIASKLLKILGGSS